MDDFICQSKNLNIAAGVEVQGVEEDGCRTPEVWEGVADAVADSPIARHVPLVGIVPVTVQRSDHCYFQPLDSS